MKFDFDKYKYGKELLIDCEKISATRRFVTNHQPFFVSFHELFFITEGSGIFKLDDAEVTFKRGTVLLLPPNRWRQWAVINQRFDGYFLIFEEEFISTFFNDALFLYRFHFFSNNATPSFIQVEENDFSRLLNKLQEIKAEIQGGREDSNHLLRSLLYYLLIQVNRIYEDTFELRDELFQDNLTLRFRKLLEHNIRSKHKVADYAEMLKVSKSHLNKKINYYFSRSCSEIIKERLLSEIKKELLFSDKTVAEIAYDLNFSEPGNLHRFFKSMMHMTPRAYRLTNSK